MTARVLGQAITHTGSGSGDSSGTGSGDNTGSGSGNSSGTGSGDSSGTGSGDSSGTGSGDNTGSGSGDTGDTGDTHVHTLIYTEAVAATCTEAGNTAYYYCSECGKYFSDGEAETEISFSDTVVAALGHDYVNGICIRCGTEVTSEGLVYELSSDGTSYTVVGIGTCTDTELIVSSTYKNLPVTAIGAGAFKSQTQLTSVTIPDSVTSIGNGAFSGCSGLTSITLPFVGGNAGATSASPSTLFGYIFGTSSYTGGTLIEQYYASNVSEKYSTYCIPTTLTSVTIKGDRILGRAFYNCSKLTSVTIGSNVTDIGVAAFCGCTSLTSITIPNSVTSIGGSAFNDCTALTSVTIGSGVTSIGSLAFQYCYKLIEVYNRSSLSITAGSKDNGYVAYYAKNVYTASRGSSKLFMLNDYQFYNDNGTYYLMGYMGTDTILTLPDSVKSSTYSIYQYAFYYGTNLTSVTIGGGVTSVGGYAFYWCTSLTSIMIPDGVTSIGQSAFRNCTSLTSATIGNSVTSIGSAAFFHCTTLTTITIGNSVTKVESEAFHNCYKLIEVYNLSSLSITAGSKDNGYLAYYAKDVYTSASESSILFMLNDYQFYNDNGMYYLIGYTGMDTVLTLPDSVNSSTYSVYQYVFFECTSLTSITIPNSVTSIGERVFEYCSSLTSVTIGDGVTIIGKYAFSDCSSLTSVTIGSGVKSIGGSAFYGCRSLTSITIPDSVTNIGDRAFEGCVKLIEVYNLSSLSITAGSEDNGDAAYYAKNVYTATSGSSKLFMVNDYQFYNDNGTYYLIGYMGRDTVLILPDSVNGSAYLIYQYAFYCTDLTSVTIGSGVKSIGKGAFQYCASLTSIMIPDSVTSIGDCAFCGCSSLTSITIPNSVTSIGDYAFKNCSLLTSVTIGSGVKSIGKSAFQYCASLTSVYYSGTASDWSAISIDSDNTYLTNATRYYYAENDGTTTAAGNYWYYDSEGNIKTWSIE